MFIDEHLRQQVFPLKNGEDVEDVEDAHCFSEIANSTAFGRNVTHIR